MDLIRSSPLFLGSVFSILLLARVEPSHAVIGTLDLARALDRPLVAIEPGNANRTETNLIHRANMACYAYHFGKALSYTTCEEWVLRDGIHAYTMYFPELPLRALIPPGSSKPSILSLSFDSSLGRSAIVFSSLVCEGDLDLIDPQLVAKSIPGATQSDPSLGVRAASVVTVDPLVAFVMPEMMFDMPPSSEPRRSDLYAEMQGWRGTLTPSTDPMLRHTNLSTMAIELGFTRLAHGTHNRDTFRTILSSGWLRTPRERGVVTHPYPHQLDQIFFRALPDEPVRPSPCSHGDFRFYFSTQLLDDFDFHASYGDPYGEFHPYSHLSARKTEREKLSYYFVRIGMNRVGSPKMDWVQDTLWQPHYNGTQIYAWDSEFVFSRGIPIDRYLTEIRIPRAAYADLEGDVEFQEIFRKYRHLIQAE